jgi:hypothetical protein
MENDMAIIRQGCAYTMGHISRLLQHTLNEAVKDFHMREHIVNRMRYDVSDDCMLDNRKFRVSYRMSDTNKVYFESVIPNGVLVESELIKSLNLEGLIPWLVLMASITMNQEKKDE